MNSEKKESRILHWFKENFTTKTIAINAIIAALYAVVTYLCGPLAYEFAQFRISEILNLMVFFNPTYTLGLTIGCFLGNILSTAGAYDMIFGTLATLISCLIVVGISKVFKNLFLAGLIPCLVNAIIVPFVIYLGAMNTSDPINLQAMYWIMFGWVFLGEFVCIMCIGYPVFLIITKKSKMCTKGLEFNRNLDFKW